MYNIIPGAFAPGIHRLLCSLQHVLYEYPVPDLRIAHEDMGYGCLLYTSDAADE